LNKKRKPTFSLCKFIRHSYFTTNRFIFYVISLLC
jgi:hypothetical protein